MKDLIKMLLGIPLFVVFVCFPVRARFLASLVATLPQEDKITLQLETYATMYDRCNTRLVTLVGEIAFKQGNAPMAIGAYNRAVECSPYNARFYFSLAEAQLLAGANGKWAIQKAIELEPHNESYRTELIRLNNLGL